MLSTRLADDPDRIAAHPLEHEASDVEAWLAEIFAALQVLTRQPLMGRKVKLGRRKLAIGRSDRSYLALDAHDALEDVAVLRAQREAGFGEA